MRRVYLLFITVLLAGCSVFSVTPQPAPAPTAQAQEVNRAQSLSLKKVGSVSVTVRGSPDDAVRAIAARANAAGVPYYQVLMLDDQLFSGLWRAQANLYVPLTAGGAQQ